MVKKQDHKEGKTSSRRLYWVLLATILCLAIMLVYYFFVMPHAPMTEPSGGWTAALVDQLSIEESLINDAFVTNCTSILNSSGFDTKYYPGKDVTIDFYRELDKKGEEIIILRTHSAIRDDTTYVDLFTSERYQENLVYGEYFNLVANGHISKAVFNVEPRREYFAIGPTFIEFVMKGRFNGSLVILMGCDSLNQTSMAEALVERGAMVVIGWDKLVDANHTDFFTLRLLQYLLADNPETVKGAVDKVNALARDPKLVYYPDTKQAARFQLPAKKNDASDSLVAGPFRIWLLALPERREYDVDPSL